MTMSMPLQTYVDYCTNFRGTRVIPNKWDKSCVRAPDVWRHTVQPSTLCPSPSRVTRSSANPQTWNHTKMTTQVARDDLSEAVGERLQIIQTAVRRRVGFIPRAVERAVHDLIDLCSAAVPSDSDDGHLRGNCRTKKGQLLRHEDGSSGSRRTSTSSVGSSS